MQAVRFLATHNKHMGCGILETIIPLALAGIGTGMEVSAADAEGKAMDAATAADVKQMQNFQNKDQVLFNQALQHSTPRAALGQIGEGQQQFRTAEQNAAQIPLPVATSLTPEDKANVAAKGNLGAISGSNFQGYSNYPLQQQLSNDVVFPQIALNNWEAQQRNSLLPILLQLASKSQSGRAAAGQGLVGLGSLLGGLGSMGGGGGGGASTASAAGDYGSDTSAYNDMLHLMGPSSAWQS